MPAFPEDDDLAALEDESLLAEEDDKPSSRSALDDAEVKIDTSARAMQKVDLDLDDAPFLADDEPEPEEAKPAPGPVQVDAGQAAGKAPFWKGKKFMLMLGALVLGLVLAGGLLWFLLRPSAKHEPPPPPPPPVVAPKPEPAPPPPPEPVTIRIDPFLVEHTDKEGRQRFLSFKFTMTTTNDKFVKELDRKKIVLRDAIYYYLRNKNLDFLADTRNLETVKKDVMTVMNQYLGNDQLETILVEEYLIK